MSEAEKDGWSEYGRLVLKELERLNENYESLREDFDDRFRDIDTKLTGIQGYEKEINDLKAWQKQVNEVWSVTQQKEAKDEVYKQKGRWIAAVAILTFIQILFGVLVSLHLI